MLFGFFRRRVGEREHTVTRSEFETQNRIVTARLDALERSLDTLEKTLARLQGVCQEILLEVKK